MAQGTVRSEITFISGGKKLSGELNVPYGSESVVLFSHGSGSSRFSTRNAFVAHELHRAGVGTFLFDLLTAEEDRNYANRFNITLLTDRLIRATEYVTGLPECLGMKIGYFGASTGAASALRAAATMRKTVEAIVSRGGRPDLAGDCISKVAAPTLLIVGELDYEVLELNRAVFEQLKCEKKFVIVPGATHLFEEPGTLHNAAVSAANWFSLHFQAAHMKK